MLRIKVVAAAKYALALKGVLSGNLPDVTDGPRVLDSSSSMALARALLEKMQRVTEAGGAKLAVLAVPERRSRTFIRSSFPEALHRDDLLVVDPLKEFHDHKGELLYWENSHGHWTPLGCELVAKVLHQAIIDQQLLTPSKSNDRQISRID